MKIINEGFRKNKSELTTHFCPYCKKSFQDTHIAWQSKICPFCNKRISFIKGKKTAQS